ncbi:MAG TPA: hypothetical protein DEP35_13715 [Deltaproteobacteria bacterium]|jgi:hypothetical protein|nr:hypothetical protein [Deltaproteobacteria bacterium]
MSPRVTLILFLLAAGLGAFVYLYEIRGADQRKEAEARAKRLFPGVEVSDIDAIWLTTTEGKSAEVVRQARGWQVEKPVVAPGDPVALDGMANALAEISSQATIPDPQAPEVYGLGDSARVVKFRAKGAEHELRIGKSVPVGANTYASTADIKAVYAVPTYRATTFQKSLDDLREHRVLRFDRNSIDRIEVGWTAGGVVLEKKDDAWRLTSPVEGPADDDTVDKLLSDASYLRADGFIDSPPPDDALALANPEVTLALSGKPPAAGQPPTSFTLKLGGPLPSNPKRRALRTGDGAVYEIATERIAEFPRDVTAYRFKEVSRFSPSDASRMELTFQGEAGKPALVVGLDRGDAGWTSNAQPLVPGKAARLAAELSHLRAAGIVNDHPTEAELKAHGLAPPQVTIRVLGAKPASGEAPLLADVEIGTSDAQGAAAKSSKSEALYRLGPELAEHVPETLAVWREKFVSKERPGAASAAGSGAGTPAELPPPQGEGQGGGNEDVFPPTTQQEAAPKSP